MVEAVFDISMYWVVLYSSKFVIKLNVFDTLQIFYSDDS